MSTEYIPFPGKKGEKALTETQLRNTFQDT